MFPSPTYFSAKSEIGSPNPNWPWNTHIEGIDEIFLIYPNGTVNRSGALPDRIWNDGLDGSSSLQGKVTATWPLIANGVVS